MQSGLSMDTIYAVSTAPGISGIAVVRVSGPDSHVLAANISGRLPPVRQLALRRLTDSEGEFIDRAMVACFPEGRSFTGEAMAEFHLHGSREVVKKVLRELGRSDGARLAMPGEFTRRAMQNGRLDLAQAEGLGDLIQAETREQLRQAARALEGALGKRVENWRKSLIHCASLLEASIDFADEEVPANVYPEVLEGLDSLIKDLVSEAEGVSAAERVREGFEVAIVGPPNSGKSTLLNFLAGREAAITSEFAGTTRDIIEVRMDIGGFPATILDTAGMRETGDPIEGMGVERARNRASKADIRIFLTETGRIESKMVDFRDGDMVLRCKADLYPGCSEDGVSGKTGAGVDNLVHRIASEFEKRTSSVASATRIRHQIAIEKAIASLYSAREEIRKGDERVEFAADELRSSIRSLDSLTGRIDTEHLLDEIFSSFCLGK